MNSNRCQNNHCQTLLACIRLDHQFECTLHHPFGMVMEERSKSHQDYRFGFNGKEQDAEVSGSGSSLDFGARIYNPSLGLWMSTDPLQHEYPSMSPYSFSALSPIVHVDKNGREVVVKRIPGGGTNGKDLILINVTASWVDKTSKLAKLASCRKRIDEKLEKTNNPKRKAILEQRYKNAELRYEQYVLEEITELKDKLEISYSGSSDDVEWRTNVSVNNATGKEQKIDAKDHVYYAVDKVDEAFARVNDIGGMAMYYAPDDNSENRPRADPIVHESGHLFGLIHLEKYIWSALEHGPGMSQARFDEIESYFSLDNAMWVGSVARGGSQISLVQILLIEEFHNLGKLNYGTNDYENDHGKKGDGEPSRESEFIRDVRSN